MDSNQSGTVGGIIWGPFQGSMTHLAYMQKTCDVAVMAILAKKNCGKSA